MKKVFIAAAVFAAMTIASCGNSQKPSTEGTDSTATEVVSGETSTDVDTAIEELAGKLAAKDGKKFDEALTTAKEKIETIAKEDPEKAEVYMKQLQEYLKNNAEEIKTVAGDKVAALATTLSSVPAAKVVEGLKSASEAAKGTNIETAIKAAQAVEKIKDAPEDTKKAVENIIKEGKTAAEAKAQERSEANKKKTQDAVDNQKKKANEAIDKGVNDLKNKLGL